MVSLSFSLWQMGRCNGRRLLQNKFDSTYVESVMGMLMAHSTGIKTMTLKDW